MTKILLVEDDRAVALGIIYSLKKEGFEITHVGNLTSARNTLLSEFDLILLDLMLPDGDGYELCSEIRGSGNKIPIIFMTACDEESNIVLGLDLGADDYVTKPIKLKELISRIKAVLRRSGGQSEKVEGNILSSSGIELDKSQHLVKKDENEISLTLSEYKLLVLLMEYYPQVLSRSMILEKLWDVEGNFIDANALNVYMKRLREKIEDDIKNPMFITTIRGVGYKWAKEVVKK